MILPTSFLCILAVISYIFNSPCMISTDSNELKSTFLYCFYPDNTIIFKTSLQHFPGLFLKPTAVSWLHEPSVLESFAQNRALSMLYAFQSKPIRPNRKNLFQFVGFSVILIFEHLSKSAQKIQIALKFYSNNRYFTWRPIYVHLWWHITTFFLASTKSKHSFLFKPFFKKIVRLWDNVNNYGRCTHTHTNTHTHTTYGCTIPRMFFSS